MKSGIAIVVLGLTMNLPAREVFGALFIVARLYGAYVNRFNYYDRSYKVIPQVGDEDGATLSPLPEEEPAAGEKPHNLALA